MLTVIAVLAACVPQLATAAPPQPAHVEPTALHITPALPPVTAESVRIAVVAHIPVADSLVSDSTYVNLLMKRVAGAVMLGLNESGIRWTDTVIGLQYAKPPNTVAPSGRSSRNPGRYWRVDKLARDSVFRQRLRLNSV